jgi:hypothetical protein
LQDFYSGKRVALLVRFIQAVKLNNHDSYEHMKDFLKWLPPQKTWRRSEGVVPARWQSKYRNYVVIPNEQKTVRSGDLSQNFLSGGRRWVF